MRSANRLTAVAVSKASKPGLYSDGLGLYLQVAAGGSKSWLFRFMRAGRQHKMGLGPVHTVTLAKARDLARDARERLIIDGVNPIEHRQATRRSDRLEAAKAITFRDAAKKYIAAHRAGWKNLKHANQWSSTLDTYVYPEFGDIAVADVDLSLVMKVIEPIWVDKTETASRVRSRIENILDWATARHLRSGPNPAAWRGNLSKLLPPRRRVQKVQHHPALPYAEIGAFMEALCSMPGIGARALEFSILTAARTGEVIGATWDEIDLVSKSWTIPGQRMKAEKPHRVPLSDAVDDLLRQLPREAENPHVFIGSRKGGVSNMTLAAVLKRMDRADITVHGFRSAFRDWSAETTSYSNEVVEMALAHTVGNKTEAAYRRGDLFDRRRRLMADWAKYCAMPARDGGDVVTPLRSVAGE